MTPAPAPAPINVPYALGQLMDRTECLPQLRDDVAVLKSDLRNMRKDFDRHSETTDAAIAKISGTTTENTNTLSYLRGKWQGITVVLLIVERIAVYIWPKAH